MPTWPGNQGGTRWYPPSFSRTSDKPFLLHGVGRTTQASIVVPRLFTRPVKAFGAAAQLRSFPHRARQLLESGAAALSTIGLTQSAMPK